MKILCFLSGSILSGKEYVAIDVIKGWLANGYKVEVAIVGWHDGRLQQKLNDIGVTSHPIKLGWYYLRQIKWSLDSLVNYLPAVQRFLKIRNAFSPDVMYVDSYRQVILLSPFLNRRVFFHVHDPHATSKTEHMRIKLADKKVHHYIAVSDFIKKDLITSGISSEKITVVHNGTLIPADNKKIYMPNGLLRIGMAGLVISRKGHEDVIEACAMLPSTINYKLLIYGNGDEAFVAYLKALAQQKGIEANIVWMGYEEDKEKIYNSVDVIVAPTRNDEPFALVALEAGAHSVPMIATKSGGFPESIIDGTTGYLVEKQSSRAICNAIIMLNDRDRLADIGTAARKHIEQHFSLKQMQHKMNNIVTH